MERLILKGWKPGLKKISLSRLLQEYAGLSLSEAKGKVDSFLEGMPTTITLPSRAIAEEFVRQASELGALVEVEGSGS